MAECAHEHVEAEVVDQTLGVGCNDCDTLLCACWGYEHVPESLWNRACAGSGFKACDQNRDDVCAICGSPMSTSRQ